MSIGEPTTSNARTPRPRTSRAISEDGFSIIEVMIAMLVLTVVLSAGVVSIAGSSSVTSGATIMTQTTTIAQRALERAEGDLLAQSRCNDTLWKRDEPPKFRTCTVLYQDMRDTQGRRYDAQLRVTPVDDPSDGIGRADADARNGDSDFQSRDYYRAEVTVSIADATAKAAIAEPYRKPYELASRLDWSVNEDASLAVSVCSHYRMDRSVDVADCAGGASTPVPNVTVTLTPVSTSANEAVRKTIKVNSRGTADITNGLPPGDYRVTASNVSGHQFYRASPEFFKAEAGARHKLSVLMSREPGQTRMCYRITNPDNGWGYWVNETNFSWQEDKSLVYRNGRLTDLGRDRRCQETPLPDPLGYHKFLFQATYALSFQQVPNGTIPPHPNAVALKVKSFSIDCLAGSSRSISRGGAGNPARTDNAWMAMYDQRTGSHQICIDFEAYPIQSVACAGPGPGCVEEKTCKATYTGKATTPSGWDPCWTKWGEAPAAVASGPFNPCPGGRSGPLQQSRPNPLGTYTGSVIRNFGTGATTYYGPGYACAFTASGDRFDLNKLTASVLTRRDGSVGWGWGSCARVWTRKGEAIIKFNDTGGNPHAMLDLSPGATKGLGYRPGDNPRVSAEIIQSRVPTGQGCAAWASGQSSDSPAEECAVVQRSETTGCSKPYPPEIVSVWMKAEARAGAANPRRIPAMGSAGSSRRSL